MSCLKRSGLIILILFFLSGLVACKEKLTYDYLMEHPLVVKQEIEHCQSLLKKTAAQSKQCEEVFNAAENLISLINEQQVDPEKFGQRMIDTEIKLSQTKKAMQLAHQNVSSLISKNAPTAEIEEAQVKFHQAQKDYQAILKEKKILLGVIGVHSPE